ncbi:hypothetical protein MRX96_018998 [Rhipicephalus microplus]
MVAADSVEEGQRAPCLLPTIKAVTRAFQVVAPTARCPPSVVPDFKTPYFEQFHSAFKDCTIRKNPSEGLVMRCDVCRVMRSTNIAETSITVEDMTYVVDTGLAP